MNRKLAAIGVGSILAVTGVIAALVLNPYGTSFHLEERFSQSTEDVTRIQLFAHGLSDCEVNVSFINDDSLLYRIDIMLYSGAFISSACELLSKNLDLIWAVDFTAFVPMRSLNMVLGTGKPYYLMLFGANLTSRVTYCNGSLIDNADFAYGGTGSLNLTFLDDVEFGQGRLEARIFDSVDSVTLHVILPAELHGVLYCYQYTTPYVALGTRWSWREVGHYNTDNGEYDPCLWINVQSHNLSAYLC